ncbi:MAG: phytoene desaturase family protein [Nitrospinales bacterium]
MAYDVLIIGAGLSGLAAGIRLAHFDKKVCILEKHIEIGGLNSFYRRKSRLFDVGLHAMTNYTPKGVRSSPLGKLLKQLRFRHDDFRLCEQQMSEIHFPEKSLRFTNDFEFFRQEIAERFPRQIDGFQKLVGYIDAYDELSLESRQGSARTVLREYLSDFLLIDMLLCPLMYYGNALENDMDWTQFVIMFKSIFKEGFAKPLGGMSYILGLMAEKFKACGGELRLGEGVRSIDIKNDLVFSLTLRSGESLAADQVISSMGHVETLRACNPPLAGQEEPEAGKMSFMEALFVLNRQPRELGFDKSVIFFNTGSTFKYRVPDEFIDIASGVVCCANNFNYPEPPPEGLIRFTFQANYDLWASLPRREYKAAKKEWLDKSFRSILTFLPDFRDDVVFLDSFTPKTIQKFTGRLNGAVYGAPQKVKDGRTPVKNLFICGTDQGFLGIIGATLSGITIANLYGLRSVDR